MTSRMAIYEKTTYGHKVFSNTKPLFELSVPHYASEPSHSEQLLSLVVIAITIFSAITHPFEAFIAVILLALLFS